MSDPVHIAPSSTTGDFVWFSGLVRRLHSATSDQEVFSALLPEVHRRFGSAISHIEESSWDLSVYKNHGMHGGWTPPPDYLPAIMDSPLVVHLLTHRSTCVLHRAALTSWQAYSRTQFYNVVCRPDGIRDQALAVMTTEPGNVCCVGISRDREFSSWDTSLFEQIRRHTEACLQRVRRSTPSPLAPRCPEIRVGFDLRPLEYPYELRALLGQYFPCETREIAQHHLPASVARWLKASLDVLSGTPPASPLRYLAVENNPGRLYIRLFPIQPWGHLLRLNEELISPGPDGPWAPAITAREREVLHWILEGKRDSEIATILGMSPRTANKHVERLFRKLGATNRQQAALHATRHALDRPDR